MSKQEQKLAEAKYYYQAIIKNCEEDNLNELQFAVSSFVNSGRSVLQYTYSDAENSGQLPIYERLVSGRETIKFFKGLRNVNIHERPAEANRLASSCMGGFIEVQRPGDPEDSEKVKEEIVNPGIINEVKYYFEGSDESQDILQLGNKYIEELENFIAAAKQAEVID